MLETVHLTSVLYSLGRKRERRTDTISLYESSACLIVFLQEMSYNNHERSEEGS